jgi:hypothetical protein
MSEGSSEGYIKEMGTSYDPPVQAESKPVVESQPTDLKAVEKELLRSANKQAADPVRDTMLDSVNFSEL